MMYGYPDLLRKTGAWQIYGLLGGMTQIKWKIRRYLLLPSGTQAQASLEEKADVLISISILKMQDIQGQFM